jgi:hypothetical protein
MLRCTCVPYVPGDGVARCMQVFQALVSPALTWVEGCSWVPATQLLQDAEVPDLWVSRRQTCAKAVQELPQSHLVAATCISICSLL